MPRLRSNAWAGFHLDDAPLPPDDAALIRRYVGIRRRAHPTVAPRDERYIVRWRCHLAVNGRDFAGATVDDAIAFANLFDGWCWSPGSQRQAITGLRLFHDWLVECDRAAANPWKRIKGPREVVRAPRVLSRAEIDRMLSVLCKPTWRDVRDRAMLSILWAGGVRVGELVKLNTGDIDIPGRRITVLGKWGIERHQPMDDTALAAMQLYVRVSRPVICRSDSSGALFLGQHGGRIDPTVVRDALDRVALLAGIDRHVWPHLLRHTFGTDLLEHGVDLRDVAELMGHRSVQSTMRYTHVAQARIRRVYDGARASRVPSSPAD